MKLNLKSKKFFIIVIALLISIGVNDVYAKCSDYSGFSSTDYNDVKKNQSKCENQSEGGKRCAFSISSVSARGYTAYTGKCYKSKVDVPKQFWYNCGGTCGTYDKNYLNSHDCDTTPYGSQSLCKNAVSSAKSNNSDSSKSWWICSKKNTPAGTVVVSECLSKSSINTNVYTCTQKEFTSKSACESARNNWGGSSNNGASSVVSKNSYWICSKKNTPAGTAVVSVCLKQSEINSNAYTCSLKEYSSKSACESARNNWGGSGSDDSGKNKTKSTTPSSYQILFDQNYGYGLACDGVTSYKSDGVCAGNVSPGTQVNFPASSKDMYRTGEGLLLGWSKSPNCVSGDIVNYSEKYTVNSNSDFYACYKEVISGYRYLAEGAIADGGESVPCGTKYWIEYCTKESSGNYCYYIEPGTSSTYRKVDRMKLAISLNGANCTKQENDDKSAQVTATSSDYGWRYTSSDGDGYVCGEALYITTCTDTECNYSKISKYDGSEVSKSGTVERYPLKLSSEAASNECQKKEPEEKVDENLKKCSNSSIKNMRKKGNYTICYSETDSESVIKERLEKYYGCDTGAGYYFDRTSVVANSVADCNGYGICKRTYSVACIRGKSDVRPTMSVKSGIVDSSGYGYIKVTAAAKEGQIDSYYYSDYYTSPTESSRWIKTNGNSFEIKSSPGVKYIWVKDTKGNISYGVSGAVIDTTNNKTTVKKLELYDDKGHIQTPKRNVSYNDSIKDARYVKLSNNLGMDSNILADGFNPFDMEYKLEVSSPTLTVYATLTSTDSKYVDGFEPRTVNLSYGVNTILIKIQDNEGKIRTYTIIATRNDDRTSDNTLNNIELSVGKIKFNSNVTDYKIEIPSNTNSVDVKATISSDKASYVSGYEPGEVVINDDTAVKLIKVISQTGSTRTYVLTFVKKGTDYIEDESLQLKDLVIPGVYLPFESTVANYSMSVEYETESINIKPLLNDENGYYEIYIKNAKNTEYTITSNNGVALEPGENFIEIDVVNSEGIISHYRLTVIRKEFGLGISDDKTLKDLKVLGYNINFKPTTKEYTVRIKQEKSLVITAVPNSNRAEVFIRGNDELTGFSTVRIKVVAENGEFETYSIDIKKDAFNKTIEYISIALGVVIIFVSSCIIVMKKKKRAKKEYFEE